MKRLYFTILLLLCRLCSFAQSDSVLLDTTYISSYAKQLTARFYYSQKYSSIAIDETGGKPALRYRPNTTNNLGIGATYRWFTLNLAYGFGFLNPNDSRGKTSYLDLQCHIYGRMLLIDLWGQNYKGYYLRGYEDTPYYIRPDITLYEYGLFGQYIFNGQKYSHKAAFVQNEWQKKSSGSWLAGAQVYYSLLKADSSLNVYEMRQSKSKISNIQIGPTAGYAYTLVMKKHFFVTASLSLGADIGYNSISDANTLRYKWTFSPTLFSRLSLGYNSDKWAINAMIVNDGIRLGSFEEVKLGLNSGNYRLTLTHRFEIHPKISGKFWKKIFPE